MKTSSDKSSATSAASHHASQASFFSKPGDATFFAPAAQFKLEVNRPGDRFEQEADKMAAKVMRMPAPAGAKADALPLKPEAGIQKKGQERPEKIEAMPGQIQKAAMPEEKIQKAAQAEEKIQKREDDKLQKAAAPEEKIQKKEEEKIQKAPAAEEKLQRDGTGAPAVAANTQSTIQNKTTGGQALGSDVRGFMEPRFGADFSNVRVHTDAESASLNNQLSARAFTYQNHIFFSRGQYQPGTGEGKQLLAHELTHTIQQGHAVQRSPQVTTTAAPPSVQRLGIQDALDKFAEWAFAIPGFRLLTIVLGFNPINMRSTDRNAANLLRALIELIPGGAFITQALDNHGVINKAAAWVEQKLAQLGDIGGEIVSGLKRFMDSLSWTDIFDLGGVWDRAKAIFTAPIGRLIAFGGSVAVEILKMVKDAILKPLAALAQGTRGYDLLRVILGEDPISGEPVPRTAENLLGGFMKFIGQEEVWENIKKGNAIARAWAWFQGALSGLMGLVRAIPNKIVATLSALTFPDILTVAGALSKIVSVFVGIAGEFLSWGLNTIWNLLEIVFDVVKPGLMGYIKKTGAALKGILKNPLPFVGNLVNAAKLGFQSFASNFATHLKNGLIDWLTGSLEGVYIPKALSLLELGKFALSVLGIAWANIRAKIVKALGPKGETIMQALEIGFDIVVALVKGGIGAAWDLIKDKLNDLKDTVVGGIVSFVVETVVQKAVPKLVAMFIPGAGFVSAIVSIYDTIMVFVQKLSKIAQVVSAFVDSIVTIASGNITSAARRVESILGGLLSLAISFLAGFIGLGKVTDKINGVIQKVRGTVDKALDTAINWVVGKAKALFGRLFGGKGEKDDRTEEQKTKDKQTAIAEAEKLVPNEGFDEQAVRGQLGPIKTKYKLTSLNLVVDAKDDQKETIHFAAAASPEEVGKQKTVKAVPGGAVTPVPVNSWIQKTGAGYEQVTDSVFGLVIRRGGVNIPTQFRTAIPGGGNSVISYQDEGKGWQRTTFVHQSKLVIPTGGGQFKLKPERDRSYIREQFYKDTDGSRKAMTASKLPALRSKTSPGDFLSQGDPALEAARGYTKKDPTTGRALVPEAVASPDHTPPIAQHWNGPGSKNNQAFREGWNKNPATFRIMSLSLNLSLGSGGVTYGQDVGIGFRGPGE